MLYRVLILLAVFITGCLTSLVAASYFMPVNTVIINKETENPSNTCLVQNPFTTSTEERMSPYDWIKQENIHVMEDKVVIDIEDPEWAAFTDTNSMDPLLDDTSNAIEIVPKDESQIHVGDVISYNSNYAEGIIIHRVVEVGDDGEWFCRVKGDNNPNVDPGKIRFNQIERVLVAIIY